MDYWLGLAGVVLVFSGLDDTHVTHGDEWTVVTGLVLVALAVIAHAFERRAP